MVFQEKVHVYIIANYKQPSNIAYLVKEFKGNLPRLTKHIPTIDKLKKGWGIDTQRKRTELTEDEKSIIDNLQELLVLERKRFVERNFTLNRNI